MSGGLSVPFAFLALFNVPQRLLFGVLAYVALGIMAISQAVKISRDSKPKLRIECTPNVPGCSQRAPNANFLRVVILESRKATRRSRV
jgi:hypothetical protein